MPDNKVDVKIREIKRRTASFQIMAGKSTKLTARVNAKSVSLSGGYASVELPKTLEAIDALADLVAAVRAELDEQGVTE